MVLAHVAVYNALNFFSRILIRSEALVYNSCFFSEQPFYGNYSTLGSHTNTVISHAVAYSSRCLPKPWQGLMNWIVTCEWILKQMVKEEFSRQFKNMMKYPPNLFKIKLFKVWSWKGTQFAFPLVLLDETEDSRTSAKSRNRRQVSNVTSVTISMHDVRHEIRKQFEQLMPTKYCKCFYR